ncbi:nucleotide-diphospho-sugar transferase [Neocallimastix sp. 'constans']
MKFIYELLINITIYYELFILNIDALPLSIVVPVFNTGPYLDRCINSILNQTFKDYELIFIDDASTDNSLQILENYRKTDNRIKLIQFNINKGVSTARNAGMDIAEGDFIGFIDSDDFIDKRFYENLIANSTDYDIVVGKFLGGTNTSKYYKELKMELPASIFDSIWRKDFLNKYHIRYDETMKRGSDRKFRMEAYEYQPRILKLPDVGIYYYYKRRTGSLSNFSKKQLKRYNRDAYEEFKKKKKNARKNKKDERIINKNEL